MLTPFFSTIFFSLHLRSLSLSVSLSFSICLSVSVFIPLPLLFYIPAGYNVVIVESVGLGQSEVEIDNAVDMLIMIVPPGGGDGLQVWHSTKYITVQQCHTLYSSILPSLPLYFLYHYSSLFLRHQRKVSWRLPIWSW